MKLDCIIGADFGGSGTKEVHWLRRTVGTEVQTLLEHNLISSNVEEIDKSTYEEENKNSPAEFGTGTVAFVLNGKQQYYQVGSKLLKRTACNIPKWKSALVKLLCILGWIERKSPGTQPVKTAIRFVLPIDQLSHAKALAVPLRESTVNGFECNGKNVSRIAIADKEIKCKPEGEGLVSPKKSISAAIMGGFIHLSFIFALKGVPAPDLSFTIEGSGALQVLWLSHLPRRDELGACAAIANNNLKFFVSDGLPLSEVRALLKTGLGRYVDRNKDGFTEIRNRLGDYGLDAIAFGGGSSFLAPVLSNALGVDLVVPSDEDFLETFPSANPAMTSRFLDIWGIFSQVPQMTEYFESLEIVESPTIRIGAA